MYLHRCLCSPLMETMVSFLVGKLHAISSLAVPSLVLRSPLGSLVLGSWVLGEKGYEVVLLDLEYYCLTQMQSAVLSFWGLCFFFPLKLGNRLTLILLLRSSGQRRLGVFISTSI